jgi:hypothetical protein
MPAAVARDDFIRIQGVAPPRKLQHRGPVFTGFPVLKAILTQINPGCADTSNLPAGK